jgi:hypothetical protein
VHMSRTKRVAPLGVEHLTDRPIVRDRIGGRADGPETAISVRAELRASANKPRHARPRARIRKTVRLGSN